MSTTTHTTATKAARDLKIGDVLTSTGLTVTHLRASMGAVYVWTAETEEHPGTAADAILNHGDPVQVQVRNRRPNAITTEVAFAVSRPLAVGSLRILAVGSFTPATGSTYAASEVVCDGDAGGFSTHTLIFNDEHAHWYLDRGHYCFATLSAALADMAER